MSKILIIEKDIAIAGDLQKMLEHIDSSIEVQSHLASTDEAIKWLAQHGNPDIIFMDIELSNGLSFEIFCETMVASHLIFITDYDDNAMKAFAVNGLDYLLKPISEKKVSLMWERFKTHKPLHDQNDIRRIIRKLQQKEPVYRTRFLITFRDVLIPIQVKDIAYFSSAFKVTYIVTAEDQKYATDETMEQLETELEPNAFFRATRQYIISAKSIKQIHHYSNGRLKLSLTPPQKDEIIISRDKATAFKDWLKH